MRPDVRPLALLPLALALLSSSAALAQPRPGSRGMRGALLGEETGAPAPAEVRGLSVRGDADFVQRVTAALDALHATRTGAALLAELQRRRERGLPVEVNPGWRTSASATDPAAAKARGQVEGSRVRILARGRGSRSTVWLSGAEELFVRNFRSCFPDAIALGHELLHALHHADGESLSDVQHPDRTIGDHEEARTIGLGPYASEPLTENRLRAELGLPLRRDHTAEVCSRGDRARVEGLKRRYETGERLEVTVAVEGVRRLEVMVNDARGRAILRAAGTPAEGPLRVSRVIPLGASGTYRLTVRLDRGAGFGEDDVHPFDVGTPY